MAEIIEGLGAHPESNKCPVWPAKNQELKGRNCSKVMVRGWVSRCLTFSRTRGGHSERPPATREHNTCIRPFNSVPDIDGSEVDRGTRENSQIES
jgi:hypothetical protein